MKEDGKEFFSQEDKALSKLIEDLKQSSIPEILAYFKNQKEELESGADLLQKKGRLYKHVMKQVLGICDGERFNLIDLITTIHDKVGQK